VNACPATESAPLSSANYNRRPANSDRIHALRPQMRSVRPKRVMCLVSGFMAVQAVLGSRRFPKAPFVTVETSLP